MDWSAGMALRRYPEIGDVISLKYVQEGLDMAMKADKVVCDKIVKF